MKAKHCKQKPGNKAFHFSVQHPIRPPIQHVHDASTPTIAATFAEKVPGSDISRCLEL